MHVHTIKLKEAVYKTANDLADSEKDLFQEDFTNDQGFALYLSFEELVSIGYYDIRYMERVLINKEKARAAIKYETLEKAANLVTPVIEPYFFDAILSHSAFCYLFIVNSESEIMYGKN